MSTKEAGCSQSVVTKDKMTHLKKECERRVRPLCKYSFQDLLYVFGEESLERRTGFDQISIRWQRKKMASSQVSINVDVGGCCRDSLKGKRVAGRSKSATF